MILEKGVFYIINTWVLILIFILIFMFSFIVVEFLLVLENKYPEKSSAWMIMFAIFPIFGFILYLLYGYKSRKQFSHSIHVSSNRKKEAALKQKSVFLDNDVFFEDLVDAKKLVRLSLRNSLAELTLNNSLIVLTNGEEKFKALLEAIETAKNHIHMEYYIYRNDVIGKKIKDLLIKKSLQGVEVRLILDGFGSHSLKSDFFESLKKAGVKVSWFLPLKFPFLTKKLNYRNHRKLVVIDGRIGFLGGINIGDEYLSRNLKLGFWRDTHLKITGESVSQLQKTFINDWFFARGEEIKGEQYLYQDNDNIIGKQAIQIITSGPDSEFAPIQQVIFSALTTAKQRIFIESPYLIPDDSMVWALKTSAMSGIDVRLIIQGIPEHKITYWASRSYFDELLNSGVKIYGYKKGILHSKVVIVDDAIGIVGSANFDIRSFQLDFEISALFYNKEIVKRLEVDFNNDIIDSDEVKINFFSERPIFERLKETNARILSPLL